MHKKAGEMNIFPWQLFQSGKTDKYLILHKDAWMWQAISLLEISNNRIHIGNISEKCILITLVI